MTSFKIVFFDILPLLSIVFGLIFGSFLSVCIYRLPLGRTKGLASLEEEDDEIKAKLEQGANSSAAEKPKVSFFYPKRSFCPHCNNMLLWWMNIPVFSWLFLRGRCHHCKTAISWRYPLVEVLSALFCFLSFTMFPSFLTALMVYFFCAALIVISFIDLEYYIIPNVITFPGMLLGIIFASINHFAGYFNYPLLLTEPFVPDLQTAGFGFLMGAGLLWFVSAAYKLIRRKEGLGFGDVKLLAVVGLLFGPQASIITIFIGSMLGTFIGLIYLLISREKLSRPLPFGPFLALGSIMFLFASQLMSPVFIPF